MKRMLMRMMEMGRWCHKVTIPIQARCIVIRHHRHLMCRSKKERGEVNRWN